MKFLLYTMGDDSKPSPPPTPEQMEEIGKFIRIGRRLRLNRSGIAGGSHRVGQALPEYRRRWYFVRT